MSPSPTKIRDEVVTKVAKLLDVTRKQILNEGVAGHREVNKARRAAMFLHHHHARCTWVETGKAFNRNPATVSLAMTRFRKDLERDPKFRAKIETLMK